MTTLLATLFLAAFGDPQKMEWTIDGAAREALVYAPSRESSGAPPLVFGFHGHGGSSQNAARSFRIHELWPEAVVVYPQGLPTPGRLTDPEGKKAGWQFAPGELERIREFLRSRLDADGRLLVMSQLTRDQARNRDDCAAKVADLLRAALVRPKLRRKTRPTYASKKRRVEEKRHRSGQIRDRRIED